MTSPRYVLGSRSPRRRELLALLVPAEQIDIEPPASPDEPGFDGLTDWQTIRAQLQAIARHKSEQVRQQLGHRHRRDGAIVITADTTIVCGENAVNAGDTTDPELLFVPPLIVLGQPPETADWQATVREWFERWYAGRTHVAATAVCMTTADGSVHERVVTTAITMRADVGPRLDWYLATEEPRGKAGGYALQGAGSAFVTRIVGSSSNVVGLPIEAVQELLADAHMPMTT